MLVDIAVNKLIAPWIYQYYAICGLLTPQTTQNLLNVHDKIHDIYIHSNLCKMVDIYAIIY